MSVIPSLTPPRVPALRQHKLKTPIFWPRALPFIAELMAYTVLLPQGLLFRLILAHLLSFRRIPTNPYGQRPPRLRSTRRRADPKTSLVLLLSAYKYRCDLRLNTRV